ncbi:hypothetical protein I3843_14G038500 [Carya illinoinensis]|nr:hypothetical protein I3760_14G039100 [Carya illinoinensis]KAG2669571.1 hypothetical protein I3760_14G039100 [Carya illinoinensis]KAG7946420.1 hypothetical protein I3843_14G038500 [Carya illinoinensis]KAG7946421.1 hypothetical protein I3843_14G038500 [Carya illinoinensis]
MSQVRDSAIKLFGRNIPVADSRIPSVSEQGSSSERHSPAIPLVTDIPSELDNKKDTKNQNPLIENEAKVDHNPEEDRAAKNDAGGQEKVLRKPNKVLPCPRCTSLETKFCYFNNYNVNQPRHFCKNCQRYWTAGGSIRNVRVGAGRRKDKPSEYHQVVVPSNAPVTKADSLNSASDQHPQCLELPASLRLDKGTGAVLNISKDAPQWESMSTVLNLKEQKKNVETPGHLVSDESSEEPVSPGSSFTAATSHKSESPGRCNSFNLTHPLQCYPVSQRARHWNPGSNAMVFGPGSSISNTGHMGSSPLVPVPGFCEATFPLLPVPYSGCVPSWDARKWNKQLVRSNGSPTVSSSTGNSSCSGNSSPILGKHSRDANSLAEETKEQSLWVPKTLRVNHPEEAAKSSIWSTLGIEPDKDKSSARGGIFKASQSKSNTNSHTSDADEGYPLRHQQLMVMGSEFLCCDDGQCQLFGSHTSK